MATVPKELFNRSSSPALQARKLPVNPEVANDQVKRILADPLFNNSRRYSSVLRFIVDRSLSGDLDSLKERIIGVEVFGRPADYDTSLDSAVRVAAIEVRKRLLLYYADPKHEKELRIELPVRSYVPEIRYPESQPVEPRPHSDTPEQPLKIESSKHRRWYRLAPIAALFAILAVFAFHRLQVQQPIIERFWAPMLSAPGPITILVGSSPLVNSAVHIPLSGSKFPPPGTSIDQMLTQPNLPERDFTATLEISSFLNHRGKQSIARFDQDSTLEDLRKSPFIVLRTRNEWAIRLGANLPYRIRRESALGRKWIEDSRNPSNRNWGIDLSAPYESISAEYGLVTRAFDPSSGQWWIGIAGITSIGTLVTEQMLLDPKAMTDLDDRLPKGWEHKNLQFVVETRLVQGSPGSSKVVSVCAW